MNLLNETEDKIKCFGYTVDQIIFIGSISKKVKCDWEFFKIIANAEYDQGFGCAEVREDLVIIFEDYNYLERREYDGSEWWEYVKRLKIPEDTTNLTNVFEKYSCRS
jgi:hypothetical protein